jgi:putative salt-induced outer membrane protein YdiY
MKTVYLLLACMSCAACTLVAADAAAPAAAPGAPAAKKAPPPPDEITLKDGTTVKAYIGSMSDGKMATATEPDGTGAATVPWADVTALKTTGTHEFLLKSGVSVKGVAAPGKEGLLLVTAAPEAKPEEVKLDQVFSIDPPPEIVTLKDGSVIKGSIQTMTGGKLVIITAFGGAVTIKWADVVSLKTVRPLEFQLKQESKINGTVVPGADGSVTITSPSFGGAAEVKLKDVTAINPPLVKAITYRGGVNIAASVSDGNTRTKSASGMANFEARGERQRLTASAATNYAQDEDGLQVRNSNARLKYDYFATKRLYAFASALLEGDYFQDLKLRTALSAGPGYQFIDRGDFEAESLAKLELFGEAGVSYFNEDHRTTEDNSYMAARWSIKIDWPFWADRMTLFHYHEGYPSMEDIQDIYISTETGLRFLLTKNFNAGVQVNYRYDSTPAPGYLRADTLYLFTLGYNFEM